MNHQPCFPPQVLTGSIQNNGAQNINPYQNLVNKKEEHECNVNLKGHSILTTSTQSHFVWEGPMNHQPCFPPQVLSGSIQNNGAQNIIPYQNLVNKKEELECNLYSKPQSILTTSTQSHFVWEGPMNHQPCFPPQVLTGSIQNNGAQNINPYQNLVNKKEEHKPNLHSNAQSILTTSPQSHLP